MEAITHAFTAVLLFLSLLSTTAQDFLSQVYGFPLPQSVTAGPSPDTYRGSESFSCSSYATDAIEVPWNSPACIDACSIAKGDTTWTPLVATSSHGYYIERSGLLYCNFGLQRSAFAPLEPPADARLFLISRYSLFAKDNAHVYYQRCAISGADPASFRIIFAPKPYNNNGAYAGFAVDSAHLWSTNASTSVLEIPGSKPASLVLLTDDGYYARDNQNVYANAQVIQGADASSFKPLGTGIDGISHYARDADNIYIDDTRLADVDASTLALS